MIKQQQKRSLAAKSGSKAALKLTLGNILCSLVALQVIAAWVVFRSFARDNPSASEKEAVQENSRIRGAVVEAVSLSPSDRPDRDLPENAESIRLETELKIKLGAAEVQACRWFQRQINGTVVVTHPANCHEEGAVLVAYNSADQVRFWCGERLGARKGTSTPTTHGASCHWTEPAHLFLKTPSATDASAMPPVRLSKSVRASLKIPATPFPCDVPCETLFSNHGVLSTIFVQDTDWTIEFSMESSSYYGRLEVQPNEHLSNHFYATTSFRSEIPLPYFSWAEYNITQPAVDFDRVIPGASFVAKNCNSRNNREALVTDLQKYIRVDSLSGCLHNAEPPNGLTLGDKKTLQRQYMLHLAFENSEVDDYITEKMWGSFESGTLPVYFGAPNIRDHVPAHSIISVHDFASTQELGEYLQLVISNKTLYDSYHEWRTKPLPEAFADKYRFTHVHSTCRMCRWSYARLYGFGWNATTQSVEEVALHRDLQLDPTSRRIVHPVQESWTTHRKNDIDTTTLGLPPNVLEAGPWLRTVNEHDGLVDIQLERRDLSVESDIYILRLVTKISGDVIRNKPNEVLWQDSSTRITILTSWKASVDTSDGCFVLKLDDMVPSFARIRIIVENVDTFHQTGQTETYYFGSLVAKEFHQPQPSVFRVRH